MKGYYKSTFDCINFYYRWGERQRYVRSSDWVVFGLSKRCFSSTSYGWRLSLFGIDVIFWFNREWIKKEQ